MSAPPAVERSPTRWVRNNLAGALGQLRRSTRGNAKPIWRAYGRVAAVAVAAMAVLLLTMFYVDVATLRNTKQLPEWVIGFFQFATQSGLAGWFLVPIGLALVLLGVATSPSLSRMNRLVLASISVRLSFLFLAIAIPGLVVTIVKRLIGRARPLASGEDAFVYEFFMWRVEYASMPSGHATNAFAVAVAFGALWPRLRPLLWTYAVVIALSRVVVGAHYPSDVVAGAIAGIIGALLVRDWMAARRLGFIVRTDGTVVPMPGPRFARIKRVARSLAGQ